MLRFAIFQIYNPSKESNIAILVKACYISRHGSGEEISTRHMIYLKQPSEVFYKNGFLKNFENIQRETPVPEFLFNEVADLRPGTLFKKRPGTDVFSVNCAPSF